MLNKFGKALMHTLMLAIVSAIAAYWVVKILTPQPTAAPPPLAATPPREPDPTLAARMFGLIEAPRVAAVSNIQVVGVFAAGKSGSAVLALDGKSPRAYVIGQEVAPGTRLVEVQPEVVVLAASDGARQELRVPPRAEVASIGGSAPPKPAYTMQGNVLTAPPSAGAPATRSTAAPSPPPASAPVRPPAIQPPQIPGVGLTPQIEPNAPNNQPGNEAPRQQ